MVRSLTNSNYDLQIGVFGDLRTTGRQDTVLEQFQYNINTKTLSTSTANGGTVTQADYMAVLTSTTATNGQAQLQTKKANRYRPGHGGGTYFSVLWTQPNATDTATQYAGIFNSSDGFFVGFKNGVFHVGYRKNGTDIITPITEFNTDHLDFIDFTKLNIFYIHYGWLGTANITFGILWEGHHHPFHTIHMQNVLSGPSVGNPVLPIRFDITKTAGSTNLIMKSASMNAYTLNASSGNPADRFFAGTVSKNTVSTEAVIINFRNPSTWQSVTNQVVVEGVLLNAAVDGTKPALVKIYKNLTITSPSWTAKDSTNSVVDTDTVGTVTPNDSNLMVAVPLGRLDNVEVYLKDLDFTMNPGDTVTITVQSASNTDVVLGFRWRELF